VQLFCEHQSRLGRIPVIVWALCDLSKLQTAVEIDGCIVGLPDFKKYAGYPLPGEQIEQFKEQSFANTLLPRKWSYR
jgi:hypothetical protein